MHIHFCTQVRDKLDRKSQFQSYKVNLIDLFPRIIIMAILNPYSAGIDFSRQSLTSVDVRLWRLKSIPAL